MKDFKKNDIDFISDQAKYLNSIKNKIRDEGKITLTTDDVGALDKVSQTLTSFKFFLISDPHSKKIMQYVVNEVHGKASASSGAAKIFDDLSDAINFITGINKNQKLLVNGVELNEEKVGEALKERLSTVSISNETDKHRRWLITAF